MRIVCSGGGTGGHIFPAIAVADEIKRQYPDAEILFIGAEGKMEMEKVPKAGYPIKGLWISGLQRRLTLRNLLFGAKLTYSLVSAWRILRGFRPDAVAGFGGYASGAAVYMASRMGIPTVIQEQNSYPGITNKILAKRVDRICVADPGVERFFPKEKMIHTGNPVREVLRQPVDRSAAIAHMGLDPEKQTVLIAGGSLGARTLNRAMRSQHEQIAGMTDVQIIWQCGSLYIDEYSRCETAELEHVHIMAFIDRMEMAYSAADLVVCRAGALTVSELCTQAKAAVLVPSPNVAEDHQTKNAMALVDRDAALLLRDADAEAGLAEVIRETLADGERLTALSKNAAALAKPNAVVDIANEIIAIAKR